VILSRKLVRVTLPLAAANVMNQSARTVMAIVGPVLAVELGLSASEMGVLAACLFAAYAAAQLPLGVALDAFGARSVQAVLMVLAAIGFAIFALSPGFAGLAAARVVLGIGVSAGLMALIKAHADWFERRRVAVVTGVATAIGALGSALTSPPSRPCCRRSAGGASSGGCAGWRSAWRPGFSCRCRTSRAPR
jgi:MFS family permease